jgi:Electron transfer flavoprotein, alpha subunit
MAILVIAEHDNAALKAATLNAVTAASRIGGDVHVLVAGQGAKAVADAAAQVAGVSKVLLADDAAYAHAPPENVAPLVVGLAKGYGHVLAATLLQRGGFGRKKPFPGVLVTRRGRSPDVRGRAYGSGSGPRW